MLKKVLPGFSLWICFVVAIIAVPLRAVGVPLYSAPVTLGWSPAADASVKGYVIYYGPTNLAATNRIVVGTNLSVTVTNMLAGTTYRLYAASYNAANIESPPSNLLTITPPAISAIRLAKQTNRSMKLDCRAAVGTVCGVQFSSTMLPDSWRALTNAVTDNIGNIVVNDLSAARVSKRFYRISLFPQPLISNLKFEMVTTVGLKISCTVPPESRCSIQYRASYSPTPWTTIKNVIADANGDLVATDTAMTDGMFALYFASGITNFYQVVFQ